MPSAPGAYPDNAGAIILGKEGRPSKWRGAFLNNYTMEHLIKSVPIHCRFADGEIVKDIPFAGQYKQLDYDNSTELPHFLHCHSIMHRLKEVSVIASRNYQIQPGDEIHNEYGWTAIVSEVVQRRPAKGDWTNNTFDSQPDFICLKL